MSARSLRSVFPLSPRCRRKLINSRKVLWALIPASHHRYLSTLRSMSEWHPCYDDAESGQHLRDLRLAHASTEETPDGSPIPRAELDGMQASVALWFSQWTTAKQLRFLRDLPADEAAVLFERLDASTAMALKINDRHRPGVGGGT